MAKIARTSIIQVVHGIDGRLTSGLVAQAIRGRPMSRLWGALAGSLSAASWLAPRVRDAMAPLAGDLVDGAGTCYVA
eukprot:11214808-Lingulodinium_polyedra.AAC.1